MSFERYHPSKLNMESSENNHYHNGNNHVHLKYAPIKIIHNNDIVNNEERRKYPQLNLRFQLSDESITRPDPTVTIPLSFLQQLIQQAYSNKQLRTINNPTFRVEENRNDAVDELIKQIQIQQKGFYPIDEEKKIQNALIQNQMNFIFQNEEAIQIIETYFADNTNLKPHFNTWLQQLEVKAIQDMLILCHSDPKGQQYSDQFKALFQKLSIEFYQKHAYAYVLRSDQQEKLKYLSQIGDILNKIMKPQEYYYFKQQ